MPGRQEKFDSSGSPPVKPNSVSRQGHAGEFHGGRRREPNPENSRIVRVRRGECAGSMFNVTKSACAVNPITELLCALGLSYARPECPSRVTMRYAIPMGLYAPSQLRAGVDGAARVRPAGRRLPARASLRSDPPAAPRGSRNRGIPRGRGRDLRADGERRLRSCRFFTVDVRSAPSPGAL